MNKITWLYRNPKKTTPEQALRIICRLLKDSDAGNIAMALRHRRKYPDSPAGHCGLAKWIRQVLKNSKGSERDNPWT